MIRTTEIAPDSLLDCSTSGQSQTRATMTLKELLVVVGILLCSRLAGSTKQSLWFDEGYTLALASSENFRSFLHIFAGFTTSEHLQPLYYGLIFLWSRFAGTSDFALRLPSVLFSVLSGVIVFSFARDLTNYSGSKARWFPKATLAVFCLSSFSCYYAQEARPYALLQCVCLAVVHLWRRSLAPEGVSASGKCYLALACIAAVLTSPFGVLVVFSLSLADLLLNLGQWFERWRWSLTCAILLYTVYLIVGRVFLSSFVAHDVVMIRQPLWMNIAYALFGICFGTTLGPPSSVLRHVNKTFVLSHYWKLGLAAMFSLAALLFGVVRVLRATDRSAAWLRILALATVTNGACLFIVFGVLGKLNVLPRHASGLYVMLFLLCVASSASLSNKQQAGSLFIIAGLVGVLFLNVVSLWQYCMNPFYRKDDYRAMAASIRPLLDELP